MSLEAEAAVTQIEEDLSDHQDLPKPVADPRELEDLEGVEGASETILEEVREGGAGNPQEAAG